MKFSQNNADIATFTIHVQAPVAIFFFVRAETTTRTDADYVPTTDYGTSGTTMVSADHVLVGALGRDKEVQK